MSKRNIVTIAGAKIDLDHVTGFGPYEWGVEWAQAVIYASCGVIELGITGTDGFKDQYEAAIKKWEEG